MFVGLPVKETVWNQNWKLYLTRPFSLFGASLWQGWYACDYLKQTLGVLLPDALLLEQAPGSCRYYMLEKQQNDFFSAVQKTAIQDPEKTLKILKEGTELNEQAEQYVSRDKTFSSLEKAVDFFNRLTLHATYFPYFAADFIQDSANQSLVKRLRSVSFYPQIYHQCILPLTQKKLEKNEIPSFALHFLTYAELQKNDFSAWKKRQDLSSKGNRFVLWKKDTGEEVEFRTDLGDRILSLDKTAGKKEIKGQVVFPGKKTGKVRIIRSNTSNNADFQAGDILVAPSVSPLIFSFLQKSTAIVTDEGGVVSHAAILCRELKKPCIVGTHIATSILNDGDYVEVDALNGIVRRLRSAKNSEIVNKEEKV